MGVRIQLSNNFQVVELSYNSWSEVNSDELESAITIVNDLADRVNVSSTGGSSSIREMATEGQVNYLCKLGVKKTVAEKMTKQEAWQYLHDNK